MTDGSDRSAASAGWHSDPSGRHQYRYWDGTCWTHHVADDGKASVDPPVQAPKETTSTTAVVAGQDGDREQSDTEPEKVRKLREFTGAGFRDTIRALRDCGGDIDAAAEALKARGLADIAWMAKRDWGEVKLLPPKCTLQSIPDTIPGDAGPKGGTGTNSAPGVCKAFQAGRCVVHGRDTGPCDWNPSDWRTCNVVVENMKYGGW